MNRFKLPLIIAIIVVVLGTAGYFGWNMLRGTDVGIETSTYQAVFLSNGQVYFGKLHLVSGGYYKLTNVYYLQSNDSSSASSSTQSTTNSGTASLVKLTNEVYAPEDAVFIAKNQVLFYENLNKDGNAVQSIEQAAKSIK